MIKGDVRAARTRKKIILSETEPIIRNTPTMNNTVEKPAFRERLSLSCSFIYV
jgi:hypothetical protein